MTKAKFVAALLLAGALAACGRQTSAPQSAWAPATSGSVAPMTSAGTRAGGPTSFGQGGLAAFQARVRARIMRADTNGDGRISQQEWLAWRSAHPGRGTDPLRQFQHFDANHDGYVTPDEIDAITAKLYARRAAMQGAPAGRAGADGPD